MRLGPWFAPNRSLLLPINPVFERCSRQILFSNMGEEGQRNLLAASAVIVGCGAIGASAAQLLARAGVGRLRIIDRDFVEPSNLQRQALFDENDARESLPKAAAAERKLQLLNSEIAIEGKACDVTPENIAELLSGYDLILDGTDNFETRFLLNDFAVQANCPWIYRSEEHTSELQSLTNLVCRLLLEKKKKTIIHLSSRALLR